MPEVKDPTKFVGLSALRIRSRLSAGADIVIAVAVIRASKDAAGRGQEAKPLPSFSLTEPSERLKLPRAKAVSDVGGDACGDGGMTRGHELLDA